MKLARLMKNKPYQHVKAVFNICTRRCEFKGSEILNTILDVRNELCGKVDIVDSSDKLFKTLFKIYQDINVLMFMLKFAVANKLCIALVIV